jgi:Putative DNA-binding domain
LDVGLEALRAQLRIGIESEGLDFKRDWDPTSRTELLELAKDFAAMESLPDGGYLIIGADDEGKPAGMFSPNSRTDFDEQRIRAKLAAVLGEPLGVDVALHELDGQAYLLIGVRPHRDGLRIMNQAANYAAGKGTKSLWREGDVFVRRGTSSVQWNQHECRAIIERIVAVRKEQWRADLLASSGPLVRGLNQPALLDVELPASAFAAGVVELIRVSDSVGLDLAIRRTTSAATTALKGSITDHNALAVTVGDFLVRLNAIACLCSRYEMTGSFNLCVEGYREIYAALDDDYSTLPRRFPLGHETVLVHAYALGAVLVDDEGWGSVASLTRVVPYATHNGYWKTLLRKAEVMSARAEVGLHPDTGESTGVIERAKPRAINLFEVVGEDPASKDVTSLLVQFDVYRGIATTLITDDEKVGAYPNFSYYYTQRSQPAFLNVFRKGPAHDALFDGNDDELRQVFVAMDAIAQSEGARYNGWSGFDDPLLLQFVRGM